MATKKVDSKHEAYKSRGKKTAKAESVGVPSNYMLGDPSMGNDGTKGRKSPPSSSKKEPNQ